MYIGRVTMQPLLAHRWNSGSAESLAQMITFLCGTAQPVQLLVLQRRLVYNNNSLRFVSASSCQ